MNTIASKHRAGWRRGKTIINEVGGKDSYIWVISDVGETGIKGYIGKPYDDIIFEWEDFYNSRIGEQPDVSAGSLNTHTASYVG